MTEITPADVLDKAADILDEKGWCRGRLRDHRGHSCALGAIIQVYDDRDSDCRPAVHEAEVVLRDHVGGSIGFWNDTQKDRRTVTRRLRAIAKKLRSQ